MAVITAISIQVPTCVIVGINSYLTADVYLN